MSAVSQALAPLVTISLAAGLVAATTTLALVVRSLFAFSQTGPELRHEIVSRFAWYVYLSLSRLSLWGFALMLWMALLGNLPYAAYCLDSGRPVGFLGAVVAAAAGIFVCTALQFAHHLLHLPSSIMMSSNYSMRRFHFLWRRLTVTRLRVARLAIGGTVVVPVILAAERAGVAGPPERVAQAAAVAALMVLLALPYLFATVQLPVRPRHGRRPAVPGRKNILMIGCDTLRADRLGVSGNPVDATPFLDALTKHGSVFVNCFTPLARTAPSLVSLLTGTWPKRHGIRCNFVADASRRLSVPALPGILAEHGYRTVALADWAGSDLGKFSLGFQCTEVPSDQWNLKYLIRQGPKDLRLFLSLFTHNRFGRLFLPELFYLAGVPLTRYLGRRTRQLISECFSDRRPFLINVFMGATHPPFGAEYPYYTVFSDRGYNGNSKFGMEKLTDPFEVIRSQKEPKEAFDLDQILNLYNGCVRNADDEIRRTVQHLWACGLGEDTIVVVYSDHGMELFEHDTWGQGNSAVGDFSARVPLVLVNPSQTPGGVDRRVVRTVDVVPTLLELLGIEAPPTVQGVSLRPYLNNPELDLELPAFFETGIWLTRPPGMSPDHLSYPDLPQILDVPDRRTGTLAIHPDFEKITIDARDRMIRTRRWKLVRMAVRTGPRYKLFDIENDPWCRNDVYGAHPDVSRRLASELSAWIEGVRPPQEVLGAHAPEIRKRTGAARVPAPSR